MKKLIAAISLPLAAIMTLCLLAGCQNSVHPAVDYEPASPSSAPVSPADTAAPAADPAGTEATEPAPEPAPADEKIRPADIKVVSHNAEVSDSRYGSDVPVSSITLTATDADGSTLWEYNTSQCYVGELDTVEYIGTYGDLVYINEQAIYDPNAGENDDFRHYLRALDVYTGKVVWDNTDFHGAGTSHVFDAQSGILYICGFYGPDCFAVDAQGKTLWTVPQVDESMWWPYELRLQDDGIEIVFDGTDSGNSPVYGYIGYDGTVFAG